MRRRMEQFNKFFSAVRISVERAFGILKARFKGLREVFYVRCQDPEAAMHCYHMIFMACCVLHNVCADKKVPLPPAAAIAKAMERDAQREFKVRALEEEQRKVFNKVGGSLKSGLQKRKEMYDLFFS